MKRTFTHRLLSLLLCMALLASLLPAAMLFAGAASPEDTRLADPSTMDGWKRFFLPDSREITTENAGGVWTDKSVFTDATAFSGTGITMDETDSFLVALSAMGSNMSVSGLSNMPTDTMMILDLSSSMYNGFSRDPATVQTMLDSVNSSIVKLQELNIHNRVGVVVYYGGPDRNQSNSTNSKVMLPLGRYSGTTAYLKANVSGGDLQSVQVNAGVKNAAGETMPQVKHTIADIAGTYAQLGILDAMDQFLAADTIIPATADYQANVTRVPIFIFMSDGEPTAATHEYTKKVNAGMGNNTVSIRNPNETDFVTQLTAAYARERVDHHYVDTVPLFYSLSLGTSVSLAVMDPENHTPSAIDGYWTNLLNNGSTDITVYNSYNAWSAPTVKKTYTVKTTTVAGATFPSGKLQRNYVDQAYTAANADSLNDVFDNIVNQIDLVSQYTPTLVDGNDDLSGYISFVDKIGQYMNVTDIKGIQIGTSLFTGAELSKNFVPGGEDLGTNDNRKPLGDQMVWAVQARLGLETTEEARQLIDKAYRYGQLSYTSPTEFSNYIGWYGDARGEYLDFWHEGATTAPEGAVFTVKSYGYLGEVDEDHGVVPSDMMYATVQLRREISTGEETMVFAVPAALIPLVTYDVELNKDGGVTKFDVTGAENPIRLVYEVALSDSINAFNLKNMVSAEYLENHTNADGSVNFYTNQYELDNTTGYGKVNTYSYFNPSKQNDRYYYVEDALIYSDTNGTLYTGTEKPTGDMYRAHTIYVKNGTMTARTGYHKLTDHALDAAQKTAGENTWYVPKGNVRVDLEGYDIYKGGLPAYDEERNTTGTLTYANQPFVDTHNHVVGDMGYNFIVGATLGNNGRISLVPETGIMLRKEMALGVGASNETFTFYLTNTTDFSDGEAYPAVHVDADGKQTQTTVQFSAGKATVKLKAWETIYIGGMLPGDIFRVEEQEDIDFILKTINGKSADFTDITLMANEFAEATFVNIRRGVGNLRIEKEVDHEYGNDYDIPADKVFHFTVTLTGIGTANATFDAEKINDDLTSITTDANGTFTFTLKHDEALEVYGLPEGTEATVLEQDPGTGFEPLYRFDNGNHVEGPVAIEADDTVIVRVINDYSTEDLIPDDITISGTKTLTGREWLASDSFTFELQKRIGEDRWQTLDTATATAENKSFTFTDALKEDVYTTIGTYYYRVIEIEPAQPLGGVTYDKTVNEFAVDVTDTDMDGKMEIADVRTLCDTTVVTRPDDDLWHIEVAFTNAYTVSGNASAIVDIHKDVINESGSPLALPGGFTFGLYDLDGTLIQTSPAATETGDTRLVLEYTELGTYKYILKEERPDPIPAGWIYSRQETAITVIVSDNLDGTMKATIFEGDTAPAEASNTLAVTFTNEYDPEDAELTIDFVEKLISGRDLVAGEFTFEVQTLDGTVMLTGTNDADGKVTFNDTLKFSKVGVFTYQVVETGEDDNGVTMDRKVYRVTVTVTDVDGVLKAAYALDNGDTIVFENTYEADPVPYAIEGEKVLEGRVLKHEEFTFVLTEANADGTPVEGGMAWQTTNLVDGTFTFPAITYTEIGIYYYLITETAGDETNCITYDDTRYLAAVDIIDDGEGQLWVADVTYTVDGEPIEEVTFVNEYVPGPAAAQIPGVKVLEGKVLTEGQFSFELYAADEAWVLGDKLETVQNALDGTFTFTAISYTEAGTYYYVVKEVNGGQEIDGVTYDDTVYHVRVDVTDDLVGQLHADTVITDPEGEEVDAATFINSYEEGPPKTGDTSMGLWLAVLFVSGGVMAALTGFDKKKTHHA